jgi:hypothetical protein
VSGSISHFDGRHRKLTFRAPTGPVQSFGISEDMLVDTSNGVMLASKYRPNSSEQVAVVSRSVAGAPIALFINTNY